MKSKRELVGLVLILVLLVLPLVAACTKEAPSPTPAPKPGEYRGTITLHIILGLSAATGIMETAMSEGYEALRRYTNEKMGGINGWKVEHKWADDGDDTPRTISIYKRWKEEKPAPIFVKPGTSKGGDAMKSPLTADKIPGWNNYPSSAQIFPPGSLFLFGLPYDDMAVSWAEYVVKERAPQRPKLAVFAHELGWGKSVVDSLQNAAPKIGADLVDYEFIGFAPVDTTTVLKRFEAKGVTDVFFALYSAATTVPISNWHDLGLKRKMTVTSISVDVPDLIIPIVKDKAEGSRHWMHTRLPSEANTNPKVKEVLDFWNSIYAKPMSETNMGAWMAFEVVYEAVRLALGMVNNDGTKLTPELMMKGFESIKDFEGTLHPKITLGTGVRNTSNLIRMVEVKKDPATGKLAGVPISDWVQVDLMPRKAGETAIDWSLFKPITKFAK